MYWFLMAVAALHVGFMFCEMFPWSNPVLLRLLSKKLPAGEGFKPGAKQLDLVATIVRNAGIYNAIIAGGLFWAATVDDPATARVLLLGAGVAGAFGTVTLKSPITAIQAVLGFVGFYLLLP